MRSFILLFFLLQCVPLKAQRLLLDIRGVSGTDLEHPKFVNDSIQGEQVADELIIQLHASAYLEAQVDTTFKNGGRFIIAIQQGKEYQLVNLKPVNMDEYAINQVDLNGRLYLNRPFNPKQLNRLFNRTVEFYEERGYPFARVRLDSILINDERQISANILVDQGKYYKIDSLKIKGNSRVNEIFLRSYLNIDIGGPYRESVIQSIDERMDEIPFLSEAKPKEVRFFEEGVSVVVYPKKKRASRFDGILGLLTEEESGKIEFTGDIDLLLINSFNRGERIGFNWRKLKGNSTDLQLELGYPYIFQSQFGVDYNFKLFRRDTTFLDLNNRLALSYARSARTFLSLFYERKSSRLLSRNGLNSSNLSTLGLGDVSINLFGVGYNIQKYDYLYNPRRGVGLMVDFGVGLKNLEKIKSLEEENPNLYEGVELNTTQYSGKLKLNYFIPIGGRSALMIGNQSAVVYSENVYQNELLRFGGLKILRGFDEEALTGSLYSFMTVEYRFLLDQNSYFALFSDGGFYESNTVSGYRNDQPIGIGAGINFETGAGIFSFNYAVGKQQDTSFDLRVAKIHFGFVNIF
jgi:outer membrane protein assembly factor BamA